MAGAGAAGVFLLVRAIFNRTKDAAESLAPTGRPTYQANWYTVAADRLQQAMFDWGTDNSAITGVFEDLKKDADFERLFNAFGVRVYTGGILPTPWLKYNLVQWLSAELSQDEIETLNAIMQANGLTYRL